MISIPHCWPSYRISYVNSPKCLESSLFNDPTRDSIANNLAISNFILKLWISNFEFLILHFFWLSSYFLSFWLSLVDIKLLILRRNLNITHQWKCLSTHIWNDPIVHGCFKFLCSMIQPWDDYQTHLFSEDFEQKRRWNLA